MFEDYSLPDLIYLLDKLDRLERIHGITSRSACDCGGIQRGGFPACRECIQKEIERRENEANH